MDDSPHIIDVTRDNFQQVMETSFEVPVLMDFWASWCQPCQVIMPVLANLAGEYQGRFLLAKLNTEEEQEIAGRFGIRSIPTVKLFRDGQPVDEFMGALPEGAIRDFLDRHVARASDADIEKAHEQLLAGNVGDAIATLEAARQADPGNPRVVLALAETQLGKGDVAAARSLLDGLPASEREKPEAVALKGRLYFEERIGDAPAENELQTRLASDPDDHEALFQLAMRKVGEGEYDAGVDMLLELMKKDRSYGDDAGRQGLLRIFELLGDDPRVSRYRSSMASLLY